MYALTIGTVLSSDNGRRILSACDEQFQPGNPYKVAELPTGETAKQKDIGNWLYKVDGNYEYSEIPDPEAPEVVSITQLRADVDFIAMMTDVEL